MSEGERHRGTTQVELLPQIRPLRDEGTLLALSPKLKAQYTRQQMAHLGCSQFMFKAKVYWSGAVAQRVLR